MEAQSITTDELDVPASGAAAHGGPEALDAARPAHPAAAQRRATDSDLSAVPRWIAAGVDFFSASAAVVAITLLDGAALSAGAMLAPALLVFLNWTVGLYSIAAARPSARRRLPTAVALLITTGLFTWFVGLLQDSPIGAGHLSAADQLVVWIAVFAAGMLTRTTTASFAGQQDERWLVVGNAGSVAQVEDTLGKSTQMPRIVGAEPLPSSGTDPIGARSEAMAAVQRLGADRVVLTLADVDPRSAVELVHTFKALGIPVSVIDPPFELVEELPLAERTVGEVSVADVGQLTRNGLPLRSGADAPRVSVIVPALNEAENLPYVLSRMPDGLHEVILVDGGSTDGTIEVAKRARPGIRVLHQGRRGKGDALRAAFAAVTGDIIVTVDADGSADPGEIPRFVASLRAGSDFAKGTRFSGEGGSDDITPVRYIGNWALNTTANVLYGIRHSDLCYGYNAFWTRCLPYISLDVSGFEVETLMTLRCAKAGLKVSEVPSYEAARIHGQSNLKTYRDGFRVLRTIISERQP